MDEPAKEKLRTLTVEVLLELRNAYLRDGANPLKHWEQLQNRMRSASRRSRTPEEWATMIARGLQLRAFGSSGSQALIDLVAVVAEQGCAAEWLDLVEREYGFLMALTRRCAEQRREAKDKEATT